ncbi:hypothetical protein HPB48_002451 [Haemaphysalis longicornis]|uniref:Uncharacterized protein n=1 Tax=Haemaphysalis longicornis TaxID=44386 RepID=A0A9J6FCK7_HAELO|nr:hypothetical protein HPB48_002451 [Haemaphysalis longicornis]
MTPFPRQKFCADYSKRHKRRIQFQRDFSLREGNWCRRFKKLLPPDTATTVHEEDMLCQNCFRRFKKGTRSTSEQFHLELDNFQPEQVLVANLNDFVGRRLAVSPLKKPNAVRKRLKASYVKRKEKEIHDAVVTEINTNIRAAYNVPSTSTMTHGSCNDCDSWKGNMRQAYVRCTSFQERCRLLTLLPPAMTAKEVQRVIPEATRHIIKKAKKTRKF